MKIKKFTFNPVGVNTVVLWDETQQCVIIDPACSNQHEEEMLVSFIETQGLQPVRLLNTHAHFDHLMGNAFVEHKWGLKGEIHKGDLFLFDMAVNQAKLFGLEMAPASRPDTFFEDGDILTFGNSSLKVIFIPGHSPGGVAFYSETDRLLIPGDILFFSSVGRTDLPGGNFPQLISGIKAKLLVLDPETTVICGHGPETTIGTEQWSNPYLN